MVALFSGCWVIVGVYVHTFLGSVRCELLWNFSVIFLVVILRSLTRSFSYLDYCPVGTLQGIPAAATGCYVIEASNLLFVSYMMIMVFETGGVAISSL